ncbi:MAG: hypothetical protein D6732_09315 [Methanobacteriota archaeon]|nr:MAG: hypothetical protein D6732_09315 [Euryarchaeota archaeon]
MHQMVKKGNICLFLGVLLIGSLFFFTSTSLVNVNASPKILQEDHFISPDWDQTNQQIQTQLKQAVEKQDAWKNLIENYGSGKIQDRYLIFAANERELEMLQMLQVDTLYPNLRAAKVFLSPEEASLARTVFTRGVFNAEAVENTIMYTQAYRQVEVPPTFRTNAYEDADLMNVVPLWEMGYNGTGVLVGVVDNGVNFDHPALAHAFHSYEVFAPPEYPGTKGHGTPVAGTIAADGTGAEPNATVGLGTAFGAKIAAAELGSIGTNGVIGDFVGAFDYMIGLGEVDVINFSIGGPINWLEPVLIRMEEANIVFVTSAGNSGTGGSAVLDPYTVGGPGSSNHAIAVGATTHSLTLASFSSEGPGDLGVQKPDVVAPGVNIYSTSASGGWNLNSGTSFSSPLTAGAIATVISGLEANGVNWTVGVIKAALRKTATDIGLRTTQQGEGFVNAKAMFDYLMSLPRDANGVPKAFDVGPKEGPLTTYTKIPLDVVTSVPLLAYTSFIDEINFTLSGNVTQFLTLDIPSPTDEGSYKIWLNADTLNNNITEGTYVGTLYATLENDTITIPLEFTILPPPKGRIYIDNYYTVFDEYEAIGQSSLFMGTAISNLILDGFWVQEFNVPFNATTASNFDVVWFFSPFGDDAGSGFFSGTLDQTAINEYQSYINGGGSVFITLLSPKEPDELEYDGTDEDVASVNSLIEPFGITMPSTIDDDAADVQRTANIVDGNRTILGRHATEISTKGFPLTLSGNARPIAADEDGNVIIAANSAPGRGRVVVTSSNDWFSSEYLSSSNKAPNAVDFVKDLFDYLVLDAQVELISETNTHDLLDVTVQVFENNTPVSSQPSIKILDNDLVSGITPNVTDLGNGTFRIVVEFTVEGIYTLQIALGNEYLVIRGMKDVTGPEITTQRAQDLNFSRQTSIILYRFSVQDPLSGVDLNSIEVTIDNMTNGFTVSIDDKTNQVFVTFSASIVDLSLPEHHLVVRAKDLYGNLSELDMRFYVYGQDTTTESSTSTTTTTTTTSTETNTTSSETESSPVSIEIVLLAFAFTVFAIPRFRKNRH